MQNKKSLVLLSGGLDSSVNLLLAQQQSQVALAITFDYGQRAAQKEILSAQKIAAQQGIPHQIVSLDFFKQFTQTSLINLSQPVPQGFQVDILSHAQSLQTAERVWVPNRNGIFLNIAAGFAEGLSIDWLVPGFNLEEASTFPDNSQEFLNSLNDSLTYSTRKKVQVRCFTTHMNKTEILKKGLELSLAVEHLWPCYMDQDQWCGICESCLRFQNALKEVEKKP